MFEHEVKKAREKVVDGWINVREVRCNYWRCDTLLDRHALHIACDCRNGYPSDYDELLWFAAKGGLGLQTN